MVDELAIYLTLLPLDFEPMILNMSGITILMLTNVHKKSNPIQSLCSKPINMKGCCIYKGHFKN